ncbi:cysteine protease StiP family protein [Paenibacillus hunanensis]|uniref:cysteine protease StiP family protein n=1 Tax=Paenibacillus hunanensis TaxID=539262 RepID=UPI002A6B522A|nr:cysteine protease StiP family protein [Paenibacillus hunanensis]WPP41866.1 cysteine protease StiP family protein [Paenibacillus hunanensis]
MSEPIAQQAQTQSNWAEPALAAPVPLGSYRADDVVFLLKDLSDVQLERGTEEREEAIQTGTHYSEMLPEEYQPTEEYVGLFHKALEHSATQVALAAGVVSECMMRKRGRQLVLVSLARAGTPVGILIKRYMQQVYGLDVPHYSISIIRGKGIDENALKYILQQHGTDVQLQFVDGWTGKGAIRRVLMQACRQFQERYGVQLSDDLAVLADPGRCSDTYGTREDFLIPSACLNSTVSGLMSRTVLRSDLIGEHDFHGSKFYRHWLEQDLSNLFVDRISACFAAVQQEAVERATALLEQPEPGDWQGMEDIRSIQEQFGLNDINLIKPGVGETTRVLLRRVPWKILIDREDNPHLQHILHLARERGADIEIKPDMTYACCGIIKPRDGDG